MRKIFTAAALTGVMMSGALPALADGNDLMEGRTASPAWQQPFPPLPRTETGNRRWFAGGEDQYLAGPSRFPAWTRPAGGTMLAAKDAPAIENLFFASQSG